MNIEEIEYTFVNDMNMYSVIFTNKKRGNVSLKIINKTNNDVLHVGEYYSVRDVNTDIAKNALKRILGLI